MWLTCLLKWPCTGLEIDASVSQVDSMWTEKEFTYDVSFGTNQSGVVGVSDLTSSDDDDEIIGPVTVREVPTGIMRTVL